MARVVPARLAIPLLLASAAMAMLAVGCGGQTRAGSSTSNGQATSPATQASPPVQRPAPRHYSPYETAMQALGNRLALVMEESGLTVRSQGATSGVIVRALRVAQHQLRVSANALAKLKPPARIKALHRQLLTGVRRLAAEFDSVIVSAKSGTDGIRIAATIPTLPGLKEMQRASDAIVKAGYAIVIHVHAG